MHWFTSARCMLPDMYARCIPMYIHVHEVYVCLRVCMNMCTYASSVIYMLHGNTWQHILQRTLQQGGTEYTYTPTRTHIHTNTKISTLIFITCEYTCMHPASVRTSTHINIHIYIQTNKFTYIHTHTFIHTHIRTYIPRLLDPTDKDDSQNMTQHMIVHRCCSIIFVKWKDGEPQNMTEHLNLHAFLSLSNITYMRI